MSPSENLLSLRHHMSGSYRGTSVSRRTSCFFPSQTIVEFVWSNDNAPQRRRETLRLKIVDLAKDWEMYELGMDVQLVEKQRGVRGLRITRSAVNERSAHPEGHPRTNHTVCL